MKATKSQQNLTMKVVDTQGMTGFNVSMHTGRQTSFLDKRCKTMRSHQVLDVHERELDLNGDGAGGVDDGARGRVVVREQLLEENLLVRQAPTVALPCNRGNVNMLLHDSFCKGKLRFMDVFSRNTLARECQWSLYQKEQSGTEKNAHHRVPRKHELTYWRLVRQKKLNKQEQTRSEKEHSLELFFPDRCFSFFFFSSLSSFLFFFFLFELLVVSAVTFPLFSISFSTSAVSISSSSSLLFPLSFCRRLYGTSLG